MNDGMYFGAVPLQMKYINEVADNIREGDLLECNAAGASPHDLMAGAMQSGSGECYAVLHNNVAIGAIGWTEEGTVWSLWTDLDMIQTRLVHRVSKVWFRKFSKAAAALGLTLCNYVWVGNLPAIKWLRSLNVVDFKLEEAEEINGHKFVPFFVKPAEDII